MTPFEELLHGENHLRWYECLLLFWEEPANCCHTAHLYTSIRLINNNWTVPFAGAFTKQLSDLFSLVGLENRDGHDGTSTPRTAACDQALVCRGKRPQHTRNGRILSERHSATQELSPRVCLGQRCVLFLRSSTPRCFATAKAPPPLGLASSSQGFPLVALSRTKEEIFECI